MSGSVLSLPFIPPLHLSLFSSLPFSLFNSKVGGQGLDMVIQHSTTQHGDVGKRKKLPTRQKKREGWRKD